MGILRGTEFGPSTPWSDLLLFGTGSEGSGKTAHMSRLV